MNRTWTIKLSLVCILLSLMLTVSCAKKNVETDPSDQQMMDNADTTDMDQADDAAIDAATEEDMAMAAEEEAARKEAEAMAQAESEFTSNPIYFDYDSSVVMDSQVSVLESKAEWLRNNPDATIVIEGHCDERGTTEYNLALGDRRAARVKSFLMDLGVDSSRMTTISYGEERPVALDHSESAWAQNRRAQFVINR